METLNCFVHIYQFYISSWKLNLLLPESSKIQAVALSAQGEHKPASLSSISCLHVGSSGVSFLHAIWQKMVPIWWLVRSFHNLEDLGPFNQEKALVEAFSVHVSFVGSSGGEVWGGSILSTRYLLERVMWKLIKVFAPWLCSCWLLAGLGVTAHHCRGVIYNYNCTNTSGLWCYICSPLYFFYTSEGAVCYMIIIYKILSVWGEESFLWRWTESKDAKLDWLCLVAVQPEGFGPRLLVSEDMVTVGAEVVAECWSDRWVVL